MSGPKGGSYTVVDEAWLAQQRLVRARAQVAVAREELTAAIAAAEEERAATPGLDVTVPTLPSPPPSDGDITELEEHQRQVVALHAGLRRDLAAARRARRTEQVTRSLSATSSRQEATRVDDDLDGLPGQGDPVAALVADAARLRDRLRDDVAATDREVVADALRHLEQATDTATAQRWRTELRHAVDAANRAAGDMDAEVERARHLLADLRSTGEQSATALDRSLVEVLGRRRRLTDELVEEVRSTVRRDRRRAEAAHVTDAVEEVLTGLGYEVGERFATALASDGLAHVRGPGEDWADHGVRIRLDEETQELHFHVVRAEDSDLGPDEDTAREDAWCADLPALRAGLGDTGVQLTIESRVGAGELPVVPVAREVLPAAEMDREQADDRRERRRRDARRPKERGR